MKQILLTLTLFFTVTPLVHAQWTVDVNNNITTASKVAIGTTNLDAKFTISEPTLLASTLANSQLITSTWGKVGTSNTLKNNLWLVRAEAGSDWLSGSLHDGLSIDATYATPQTNTRTWWERFPYRDIQSWGNGANTYVTLKQGNLGIGTTTPQSALDVTATSTAGDINTATLTNPSTSAVNGAALVFDNHPTLNYSSKIVSKRNNDSYGTRLSFFTQDNVMASSLTEKMTITKEGFVGIGTTSPAERLSVNGTIRSQQVKVEITGWPDYVFKKDYELRSLQEVKAYIDQNQHLPDVPSEQEIAEKGLNLGEMNKLLMKKIEELTLYLIEKDKEMNELKARLDKLEK